MESIFKIQNFLTFEDCLKGQHLHQMNQKQADCSATESAILEPTFDKIYYKRARHVHTYLHILQQNRVTKLNGVF